MNWKPPAWLICVVLLIAILLLESNYANKAVKNRVLALRTQQTLLRIGKHLGKGLKPIKQEKSENIYLCPVCGFMLGNEYIDEDGVTRLTVLDINFRTLCCLECGYEITRYFYPDPPIQHAKMDGANDASN